MSSKQVGCKVPWLSLGQGKHPIHSNYCFGEWHPKSSTVGLLVHERAETVEAVAVASVLGLAHEDQLLLLRVAAPGSQPCPDEIGMIL